MCKPDIIVHCSYSATGKNVEEILLESFRAYLDRTFALERSEMVFYPR